MKSVAIVLLASCGRIGFDIAGVSTHGDAHVIDNGMPSDGSPDAAVLPPGAKIWLRMDSDAATGIIDSAGGHTSACVTGCPPLGPGLHAGAYQFSSQEIDVANAAADLDSSGGFTGAIWVNLKSLPPSIACPWSKPFDNMNGYDTFALCVQPSGAITYDSEAATGTTDTQDSLAMITPGMWHHIAFTWDGTTKRGYLDGVEVVNATVSCGSGTLALGLGAVRNQFFVDAMLDDALYYTRALTAAEVLQLARP